MADGLQAGISRTGKVHADFQAHHATEGGLEIVSRRRKLIGRLSLTRRTEFNETASPLPVPSLQTSRPPLRPLPGQNASVPSSSRSRNMFLGNALSSLLH